MKKLIFTGGAVLLMTAGLITLVAYSRGEKKTVPILAQSYKDATYVIEREAIIPTFFGNEVFHDLNDDGREDVAFIVTHSSGGSGTFYYVVAALNMSEGYRGSEGFLLGDRIAPQSTNIDEGIGAEGRQRQNVIVVNYADRKPDEPMTAKPTVGKSVWLKLDSSTMQFGEVARDFEGETR